METEVRIMNGRLMVDAETGTPIVVLESVDNPSKGMAFWPAEADAHAIFAELVKMPKLRPMTQDLFKDALDMLKAKIEKVVITHIADGVYYASIFLRTEDRGLIWLDSRPSDAISMALRCGAKIYADDRLLSPIKSVPAPAPALPAVIEKPPDEDTEMITSAEKSADLSKIDTKKMPRA
ncbi:MAG: bifunctional nuclease family protein [bacterium]|nr:bifunctional nuclease family protein [bacterium]